MPVIHNMLKKRKFPMVFMFSCILLCGAVAWAANPTEATQPQDLVFVIDNSGSMKKNDPNFITPQVVRTFLKQLHRQSQVAMVLFDAKARLLMPLTLLSDNQANEQIDAALAGIDYGGQHTNTPIGIERAIYELRTKGRQSSNKGIILITDGIVDTGDSQKDQDLTQWLKNDLTSQCRELGIRIFGIALTDAADFSLIQSLATRTDGNYYRTYEASQIPAAFDEIQARLIPHPAPAAPPPLQKEQGIIVEDILPRGPANGLRAPQPAQMTAPPDKTVVVIKQSPWIQIALIVVAVICLGVLLAILFFFRSNKGRSEAGQTEEKKLTIPEAHLEDTIKTGQDSDGVFHLDSERITIGRDNHNHLILEQPAVSGFHATIEFRNMSFYLEDQRSTNGTLLNGRRLKANDPVRLKSGDLISFAKRQFKFILADTNPFGDTVMLSRTALTEAEDADATIVLDLDSGNSKEGLIKCLQNHLMQIYDLGIKYKEYVNTYFAYGTLKVLATAAHENLQRTQKYEEQYCTPIIKDKTFYLVCSLPVSINNAADWYGQHDNGYSQFVLRWLKSKQYLTARCNQLCIVTFGQDPATWVSFTIVPTHSDPDAVEIMSVDFLNQEEISSLALDFDNHGRII